MVACGSLAWFSTYVIACAVNGKVPQYTAVTSDVPSQLFSYGGVFGVQRPTIEVIWRVTCAGFLGLGALGVCDILYARHTKARYFALHVIANIWISLLCLPDLYAIFTDPLPALTQRETVNHWPTSLVFSIHVYHMLFFKDLAWIDLLHHVVMIIVGTPLVIVGEMGHLMNFNNFFMCGVPGGTDYAMLFAVKHGWMEPLSEKKINAMINVWVREPALIFVTAFGFIQMHLQHATFGWGITGVRLVLMVICSWNGLFFMERVVGNYHVCNYKAQQLAKAAADKKADGAPAKSTKTATAADAADAFSYESEEHFSSSMPCMGMRVSVSAKDLHEISGGAGAGLPYPVGEKPKAA